MLFYMKYNVMQYNYSHFKSPLYYTLYNTNCFKAALQWKTGN